MSIISAQNIKCHFTVELIVVIVVCLQGMSENKRNCALEIRNSSGVKFAICAE